MRIMITGSEGVIGKEIIQLFRRDKKYKLFLLTNKKIKKNKKKGKLFYQDLTKPIKYKFKVDVIIHCASKNPASKIGNSPKNIYSTNVKMTKNLIKFSNENDVKKIIFFSSMDVYGFIKKKIVTENLKPRNSNLYGKSKFLSEKLFNKKNNKFKTISLRIPGVFALNLSRNQPLIVNMLKKIMNEKNVYAYNLNSKFNNVTDTYEIVKFLNIVLKKKKIKNSIYNFSASKPMKFIILINSMKKLFKSKSKIIQKDSNKTSFIISNRKIKKDFNIQISTTKNIILRCCRKIQNTNNKVI